ncbi:M20/M25/M40 family metallo-hydrolase [Candidatus Symbiopectobacterium sp. PLON1]|uniref:M20/M25/M40 family metallo-hydrolase n=1 Tax=Candidatus Symbiopectobacterium sp. PLON1 TaxID=2794575 RepID=UPI00345BB374
MNVGKINGGEWPGSVAEKCSLVFNTGFLPPSSIESIESRICNHLRAVIDAYPGIKVNYNFKAGLRNQAYLSSIENSLINRFMEIASLINKKHTSIKSSGWRVSCDARHYANLAMIPTVIFGAGALEDAHSANEHITIDDLKKGMFILANFLSGGYEKMYKGTDIGKNILFCGNGLSGEILNDVRNWGYNIFLITEFPYDNGLEYCTEVVEANSKNVSCAVDTARKLVKKVLPLMA